MGTRGWLPLRGPSTSLVPFLKIHVSTVKFSFRASSGDKSIYQYFEAPPWFDSSALLRRTITLQRSSIGTCSQEKGECHRGSGSVPRISISPRRRLGRTGSRIVFFAGCRAARSDCWRIYTRCERRWPRASNWDKGRFRVDPLANEA